MRAIVFCLGGGLRSNMAAFFTLSPLWLNSPPSIARTHTHFLSAWRFDNESMGRFSVWITSVNIIDKKMPF
jgi:hypothetical protein